MDKTEKEKAKDIITDYKRIVQELRACLDKEKDCRECELFTECMKHTRSVLSIVIEFVLDYMKIDETIKDRIFENLKKVSENGNHFTYYS